MVSPNAPSRMVSIQIELYCRTVLCATSSRDMMAISRALVTWCSAVSSSPVTFSKLVPVMPSARARSFIFPTNACTLPQRYSASATAASFPDATATDFSRSWTDICSPSAKKTWLPPMEAA